jgi:hypothetical protein
MRINHSLLEASDTLRDLLYVSYLLPKDQVVSRLPIGLELAEVDGGAFVSIVIFRNTDFKFQGLPVPLLNYGEINIRTYVRSQKSGEFGMYLLRSGITSRITSFYANIALIPWDTLALEAHADYDRAGPHTTYSASGEWYGTIRLSAHQISPSPANLPPFSSVNEGLEYLTRPLIGWYSSGQHLYRLDVVHPLATPILMALDSIEFPYLGRIGLLSSLEMPAPHSVLLVPQVVFRMRLPQRRVS